MPLLFYFVPQESHSQAGLARCADNKAYAAPLAPKNDRIWIRMDVFLSKGSSINDVRRFLMIFDPPSSPKIVHH